MPDLPAPGDSGGFLDCGSKKIWLLMPYYIAKAMFLLMIGKHPIQNGG